MGVEYTVVGIPVYELSEGGAQAQISITVEVREQHKWLLFTSLYAGKQHIPHEAECCSGKHLRVTASYDGDAPW